MQIEHENIKTPNNKPVSDWVLRWIGSKSSNDISKAFDVCELVAVNEFQLKALYYKLKSKFELIFRKHNLFVSKFHNGF